ncbi:MAG: hypothetical protein ACFFC7_02485 [Candidatus Hermodarchaeota archaeon]
MLSLLSFLIYIPVPTIDIQITRIADTDQERAVLEYIETIDLWEVRNSSNPWRGYILNNATLESFLKEVDLLNTDIGSYTYKFHWIAEVYESQFPYLNATSFLGSYPSWTEEQWLLNDYLDYLTWWDVNDTQHFPDFGSHLYSVSALEQVNFSENLAIKWVHAAHLYRYRVTPYSGSLVHVSQIVFLNEDLDLVCFAISATGWHADP